MQAGRQVAPSGEGLDPHHSGGLAASGRVQNLDERLEVDLRLGLNVVIPVLTLFPGNLGLLIGVVGHHSSSGREPSRQTNGLVNGVPVD